MMRMISSKDYFSPWNLFACSDSAQHSEGPELGRGAPGHAPSGKTEGAKSFMPVWTPLCSGSSGETVESLPHEEKEIAKAAHYYFQANYQAAVEEATRYGNSAHPDIRAAVLLVRGMANTALGNTEKALDDFHQLHVQAQSASDPHMAAIHDNIRFLMAVFFHLDGVIEPIHPDHLAHLSEGARLYALYAQAHALYLQREYARALGMAEAALMIEMNRYPSTCIYLNLVASMAAINLSRNDDAERFFQTAWRIAKPENYIQPFVEHHGLLQGQVEKYIRDREPEQYKRIADKVVCFRRGWARIHNPRASNKVTDRLSPYEFALAMMAVKGKTNQEIAAYLHISANTVKLHLSNIYQKLGISSRKELEAYLDK